MRWAGYTAGRADGDSDTDLGTRILEPADFEGPGCCEMQLMGWSQALLHRCWEPRKDSLANAGAADERERTWPKPPCQANADAPEVRKPVEDVDRLSK